LDIFGTDEGTGFTTGDHAVSSQKTQRRTLKRYQRRTIQKVRKIPSGMVDIYRELGVTGQAGDNSPNEKEKAPVLKLRVRKGPPGNKSSSQYPRTKKTTLAQRGDRRISANYPARRR